jgi:ABC-type nickel/cobalt efflux system permease component RcnA
MTRLTLWQMKIKQKISTHVRNFKQDGRIAPLVPLFLLAFAYGIIHAAGPGHGKGIAMAYALTQGRSCGAGLLLGALIAVIHAGSAILLVIVLRFTLEKSISTNLASVSQATQVVSYSLITLIGIIVLVRSLAAWFRKGQKDADSQQGPSGLVTKNPLTAACAIGLVPCPGVIMILLFCLSLDQMILGLLLGMMVSLGMAITITLAVWLSLAGKNITLRCSRRWENSASYFEKGLDTFSGLLLTTLGGIFLAATLW